MLRTLLLALVYVLGVAQVAYAGEYRFITLDAPFYSPGNTAATALNDRGQIVGAAPDSSIDPVAFLFGRGTFTELEGPYAESLVPRGINDHGQISGFHSDTDGVHGFLLDDGILTVLDVPGGTLTEAIGINNRKQIVGDYRAGDGRFHGFIHDRGTFTTVDVPFAGAVGTGPQGINDRGDVVGFYDDGTGRHGFIFRRGVFTTFNVPGAVATALSGINNRGQVIGSWFDGIEIRSFVYEAGSGFIELRAPFPGVIFTDAFGINDRGEIVGRYLDTSGNHGFLAVPNKKRK